MTLEDPEKVEEKQTEETTPEPAQALTPPNEESTSEPASEEEKEEIGATAEEHELNLIKASDKVREYFLSRYKPWIFLFQIDSVEKNSLDHIYIVKCSFFPIQGSYEKKHFIVKVNIKTGVFEDLKGFSENINTGEKKSLDVKPPKEDEV